jgi:ubiquinone/menaquinone biosynthesis C-methylase UbiE
LFGRLKIRRNDSEFNGVKIKQDKVKCLDGSKVVRNGFDRIGGHYQDLRVLNQNHEELEKFMGLLQDKARVLDAGCGTGIPVTKYLVEQGFEVIGVDFSKGMLDIARENVPKARLFHQDITNLDFQDSYFDGLVSFYTIIHIPKEKHKDIIRRFNSILKPNGILLVTMLKKADSK